MELALTAKQYEGQDLGDVDFADRELLRCALCQLPVLRGGDEWGVHTGLCLLNAFFRLPL